MVWEGESGGGEGMLGGGRMVVMVVVEDVMVLVGWGDGGIVGSSAS